MQSTHQSSVVIPNIKLQFMRADRVTEIPLCNLAQTICITDFDLTIKYPRLIPNPVSSSFPLRDGAYLRGGNEALEWMKKVKEEALGYYLVSAAAPSKIVAEALIAEMRNLYTTEKIDISHFFSQPVTKNEEKFIYSLTQQDGVIEEYNRCYIKDNIILNDYHKAAGALFKIMQEDNNNIKISNIVFVDDFVMNAFNFSRELIPILNNIKDKLSDELTITTVWLDPACEIEKNCYLKNLIENSSEDSNLAAYRPFQTLFPHPQPITLTIEEFDGMAKALYEGKPVCDHNPISKNYCH